MLVNFSKRKKETPCYYVEKSTGKPIPIDCKVIKIGIKYYSSGIEVIQQTEIPKTPIPIPTNSSSISSVTKTPKKKREVVNNTNSKEKYPPIDNNEVLLNIEQIVKSIEKNYPNLANKNSSNVAKIDIHASAHVVQKVDNSLMKAKETIKKYSEVKNTYTSMATPYSTPLKCSIKETHKMNEDTRGNINNPIIISEINEQENRELTESSKNILKYYNHTKNSSPPVFSKNKDNDIEEIFDNYDFDTDYLSIDEFDSSEPMNGSETSTNNFNEDDILLCNLSNKTPKLDSPLYKDTMLDLNDGAQELTDKEFYQFLKDENFFDELPNSTGLSQELGASRNIDINSTDKINNNVSTGHISKKSRLNLSTI